MRFAIVIAVAVGLFPTVARSQRTLVYGSSGDVEVSEPQADAAIKPDQGRVEITIPDDAKLFINKRDAGRQRVFDVSPSPFPSPQFLVEFQNQGRLLAGPWVKPGCVTRIHFREPRIQLNVSSGTGGYTTSFAFRPDGKQVLIGRDKDSALLWDIDRGRMMWNLYVRTGSNVSSDESSVAFVSGGKLAVVASEFAGFFLSECETGEFVRVVDIDDDIRGGVFLWADVTSARLLSVNYQGDVILWDTNLWKQLIRIAAAQAPFGYGALSADRKSIITADASHKVSTWDAITGRKRRSFQLPDETDPRALSRDGTRLLAYQDGNFSIWDVLQEKKLNSLAIDEQDIVEDSAPFVFSPDGKSLVAGSFNGALLFETATGRKMKHVGGKYCIVRHVAFSPDGRRLLIDDDNLNQVSLWDIATGQRLLTLSAERDWNASLAFSEDGQKLVAVYEQYEEDRDVEVEWDIVNGRKSHERTRPPKSEPSSVATPGLSPNGELIVTELETTEPIIRRRHSTQRMLELKGHREKVRWGEFANDNQTVLTASYKELFLWDVLSGKRQAVEKPFDEIPTHFAYHLPSRRIAVSADGTIWIYDSGTGKLLATIFSFNQCQDWLVTTPSGHFDGTEKGQWMIRWQVGDVEFPVERFAKEFHRPDEVARSLATKPRE